MVRRVQSDRLLVSLIRRKFAIKCTTGYSLNALVRGLRGGGSPAGVGGKGDRGGMQALHGVWEKVG